MMVGPGGLGALVFAAATGTSLLATPLVRALALRVGACDQPGARKVHLRPTPLLGGLAIGLAYLVAEHVSARMHPYQVGTVCGGLLILVVGVVDDLRRLRPSAKLACQCAAAVVLLCLGARAEVSHVAVVDTALSLLWVVGITNALNLSDNMDGLSAGLAAIAAFWFVILGLLAGEMQPALASLALCGACLGFLRHNFAPARIFMGDAGSLFIGYVLAAIGMRLTYHSPWPLTPLIPPLVLAVPIFDTTLVTVLRLREGRRITDGGKDHASHRLVRLGCSTRRAVTTLYLAGMAAGLTALALTLGNWYLDVVTLGVVAGLAGVAARRLSRAGTPRPDQVRAAAIVPPSEPARVGSGAGGRPGA